MVVMATGLSGEREKNNLQFNYMYLQFKMPKAMQGRKKMKSTSSVGQ